MTKTFASHGDTQIKTTTFTQLSENAYAYTAQGDPNSGVVIGNDSVLVVDTTATPAMAQDLIAKIRAVTDKPIRHLVLSHYHAVRVLGASAFLVQGCQQIIASRGTYDLIAERGAQDMQSEIERFPRLFAGVETIPGLTWPTLVFEQALTLRLGTLEVRIAHLGAGHTQGDTVVWLPSQKVLFSGDLVEHEAACYCGDAHLAQWPATLEALRALGPEKLVPGRGPALLSAQDADDAIRYTNAFVTTLLKAGREARAQGLDLKGAMRHARGLMDARFGDVFIYEHCLPFDVSRAFDEAGGIAHPRIWTAQRDRDMWAALQG